MKCLKKYLAMILALAMLISCIPAQSIYASGVEEENTETNVDNEDSPVIDENINEDDDQNPTDNEDGSQDQTDDTNEPSDEENDADDSQNQTDNTDNTDGQGEEGNNEEFLQPSEVNTDETPEESEENKFENAGISYTAHVQTYGWQKSVTNGALIGTTGQAKRVEALKINLTGLTKEQLANSGVEYSAHVQTYGWQNFVSNGALIGTTGQAKRVEALKIRLTGEIAEYYDIYYRVHCQSFGWMGWAKNGEPAGSSSYAKRVEALEIRLVEKGSAAPGSTTNAYKFPRITYQTHVQSYGWLGKVQENEISGTIGKAKRIESIKISLPETKYSGGIKYRVYVQSYGWQNWKYDGQLAGTSGQAKRIEAIEIQLTGEMAKYYDVYYSLHMAKIGWTNYAVNGETAGSSDLSKRIEAIKIKLVEKGVDSAPNTSGVKYIKGYKSNDFYYTGTVQKVGATANIAQGGTLGTTGKGKSLQNITLYLNRTDNLVPSGTIQYATYVSKVGWTGWSEQGTISGNTDGSAGLEAVKIKLSGDISKYYDIYYRAHVQGYGWLGWAKNGQPAGTTKCGYRMEALQIRLVSKDSNAPGENRYYYTENKRNIGFDAAMAARANLYSSPTSYIILVDRGARKVGIYQGWRGAWNNIKYWNCSVGAPETPTVTGVFRVGSRGPYFYAASDVVCHWWTQFYGDYLFHSVLYYTNGKFYDYRLGMALSHGCIRLDINNAKWIHDNIPAGTTVVVYN